MSINRTWWAAAVCAVALCSGCQPNDALTVDNETNAVVNIVSVDFRGVELTEMTLPPKGRQTTNMTVYDSCSEFTWKAVTAAGRVVATKVKPCGGDVWVIREP